MELRTARLRLRPPAPPDAQRLLDLMRDPLTTRWNPDERASDLDAALAWCARAADWSSGEHATWSVLDRASGVLLATVSMHQIDERNASAEVGFRTHPDARGQGVAPEAVDTATRWAFGYRHIERVALLHAATNLASCRVAQRAGFVLEGTLRRSFRYGDHQLHDEHAHARLVSDPEPPPFPAGRVVPR